MSREVHVYSHGSTLAKWRQIIEIAALVAAGVWAFYVFVYKERIKPAGEAPNIQILRSATHEALPRGKELVTVIITLKNIGTANVEMGGLIVNAYGIRYGDRIDSAAPATRTTGLMTANHGLVDSKPVLLYTYSAIWIPLGSARPFKILSGDTFTIPMSFVIQSGSYDTLRLNFARCDQRADNLLVTRYLPRILKDGSFDVSSMIAQDGAHSGLECGGTLYTGGEFAL
ncbi:MAG: hypothetical protein WA629_13615 [Candidatus Aquilonibacter sp.]